MGPLCVCTLRAAEIGSEAHRIRLQQIFRTELGKHDRTAISSYLAYTGLGYGYEWCAAFVSYCFGKAGQDAPRTPWSPSLFPNNRTVWQHAPLRREPKHLLPGMVFGIYVQRKKRIGHVGFVDSYRNSFLITVEGNTSDPEGKLPHGVYRKKRHWRTIHRVSDWLSTEYKIKF